MAGTSMLRTLAVQLKMESGSFIRNVNLIDKRMSKLSRGIQRQANIFNSSLGQMGATIASGFGLAALTDASDVMVNLRNKLNATYDSTEKVARAMNDVKRIARDSRSELSAVGTLYQRVAVATEHLGVKQSDVAKFTQVVANTFLMSGTTASEAANSARQLAQGLASGTLRGDEFRSVSENNVVLTNMLAESLGMTVGQLRLFSQTGALTAEVVMPALIDRFEETNEAVRKMQPTIGQARVLVNNAFTEMVDRLDQAYGVSKKMAEGLLILRDNIHVVAAALSALAAALITRTLVAFVAWIAMGIFSAITTMGMLISTTFLLAKALTIVLFRAIVIVATAMSRFVLAVAAAVVPIGIFLAKLTLLVTVFGAAYVAAAAFGQSFKNLKEAGSNYMQALADKVRDVLLNIKLQWLEFQKWNASIDEFFGFDSMFGSSKEIQKEIDALKGESAGLQSAIEANMAAASAALGNFVTDFGASVVSQVESLKTTLTETIPNGIAGVINGVAPDGGSFGEMYESWKTGIGEFIDSVVAKMGENLQPIMDFWNVLKGGAPGAGSIEAEEAEKNNPMSWAERWKEAIRQVKEAFSQLGKTHRKTVKDMIERYDTFEEVLAKGIQNLKKSSKIRQAILLREAIIEGKSAILKAWNSAPFPANLPAVAFTTASVGYTIREIMKGQVHDGMDSLPSTGTYMLERGERVVSSRVNRDLTEYLAAQRSTSAMRGPESVTLQVNGVNDPDLVINALATRRGELEGLIRSIANENVRLSPV